MLRFLMAASAVTVLFVGVLSAACGGSKKDANATGATPAATETAPTGLEQPTAEDKVLPTPTKAAADDIALTVVSGEHTFAPTVSAFGALTQTEVKAGDQSYKGVTVAALGGKVSAAGGSTVTIQGIRNDGKRQGFVRYPLADIASTTVLVMDDTGHLSLASSSIPKEQWLTFITGVAFQ